MKPRRTGSATRVPLPPSMHSLQVVAVLFITLGALFAMAPAGGEFYWSDAPRHALNGVFLKDFVAAMPIDDPIGFAYRYYAQYPALTILFYPPLFYLTSAPFYALFGASHATALAVVFMHYLAFAIGTWRLFSIWLPGWRAVAATLMLVCAPEIAFWGRQIMLEIPAFAFLAFSVLCFTRYRRHGQATALYASALLLVLGLYTKASIAFIAPVFALTLMYERGRSALNDRHVLWAAGLSLLALCPLAFMTMKFGQANIQSVTGIADSLADRNTLAGWTWYLERLPAQLGWPLCIAAVGGVWMLLRRSRADWDRQRRADALFWAGWLVLGYLFYSAIDLKEARHSVFMLPPVVMLACAFIRSVEGYGYGTVLWAIGAGAVLMQTLFFRPVFYVDGYDEAVNYIAEHAPARSNVLFSGYRDGAFIFNLRCREDRRDLGVVRADKLLLKVAVRRELGAEEKPLSEAQLRNEIDRLGIRYVVAQPDFWNDLPAIRRLHRILDSDQFEIVRRIPTRSNYRASDSELVIYRNRSEVQQGRVEHHIDLPIIDRSIAISR